jgi:hypothetical protein
MLISKWIAELYDQLCHQTFLGYYSQHLSESEAKIFFTNSMSLNFESMTRHFYKNYKWLWRSYRDELINHFEVESSNNIQFMEVKYPQKRKTFVSE